MIPVLHKYVYFRNLDSENTQLTLQSHRLIHIKYTVQHATPKSVEVTFLGIVHRLSPHVRVILRGPGIVIIIVECNISLILPRVISDTLQHL